MEIFPEYSKYRRSSYCSNGCSPNHCCSNGCSQESKALNKVPGQGCYHYYCNFHYTGGRECCSMICCHYCCNDSVDMKKEIDGRMHYACYSCAGNYNIRMSYAD